jgi:hypothetical protein
VQELQQQLLEQSIALTAARQQQQHAVAVSLDAPQQQPADDGAAALEVELAEAKAACHELQQQLEAQTQELTTARQQAALQSFAVDPALYDEVQQQLQEEQQLHHAAEASRVALQQELLQWQQQVEQQQHQLQQLSTDLAAAQAAAAAGVGSAGSSGGSEVERVVAQMERLAGEQAALMEERDNLAAQVGFGCVLARCVVWIAYVESWVACVCVCNSDCLNSATRRIG